MAKSKPQQNRRRSLSDPLSAALQPPANETLAEKERRLIAEHEAKQISDNIDEMLRQEKNDRKRAKATQVKILLLGQSESGKSTTFKRERVSFYYDAILGWSWKYSLCLDYR
jgi:guanine nucleotide-binding protein subunit alpha